MPWSISESAVTNFILWAGVWGIGGCFLLFVIEKMIKDLKIPGRVYGAVILLAIGATVVSTLWAGRTVEPGKTKAYKMPKAVEITPVKQVKEQNKQIQEDIDNEYKKYSDGKEEELREESDDFFNKLMEQENSQRKKADKNKKQQ